MAENPGTTRGAGGEDSRPRPKYGELAPEGWNWQPPPEAAPQPPVERDPVPDRSASERSLPGRPAQGRGPDGLAAPGGVPAWDKPVTLVLLVLGLFGAFFAVSLLGAAPEAVQVLYTQQGLGDYTPDASVAGLITAGGVSQTVLWLLTTTASVWLLMRGRRAFYVPLIGGAVSLVVVFVFLAFVLATDPTLLDVYSRQ